MKKVNSKKLVPQEFSGNDFSEIIGAPLVAASKANSAMARDQVEFLLEYGFVKDGENLTPRMITMSIARSNVVPNENGEMEVKQSTAVFEVPLVTMLPMNSLAVEKVTIDFEFEVTTEVASSEESNSEEGGGPQKGGLKLKGRVGKAAEGSDKSSSQYSSKSQAKFKVNVISGTLPLPPGVKMMLDLYTKSMNPKEIK